MTDYDSIEWAKSLAEHAATQNAQRMLRKSMVWHLYKDHSLPVDSIARQMSISEDDVRADLFTVMKY